MFVKINDIILLAIIIIGYNYKEHDKFSCDDNRIIKIIGVKHNNRSTCISYNKITVWFSDGREANKLF
jgi:hypothetical protein